MNMEIPHGAIHIALSVRWIDHLLASDFEGLWAMTHPTFRTVAVQAWRCERPDAIRRPEFTQSTENEVLEGLVVSFKEVAGWEYFAEYLLESFTRLVDDRDWGPSTSVRVISPSVEGVALIDRAELATDENGNLFVPVDGTYEALSVFFEEFNGTLLVRGFGGLFSPGWPPQRLEVDINSY